MDGVPAATATVGFNIPGPPAGALQITSPPFGSVHTSGTITVAGTAQYGASVRLSENGSTLATVPVTNQAWSTSLTFPEGTHNVTAEARDANGNPINGWTYVEFAVDTAPPQISVEDGDFPFALPLIGTELVFDRAALRGQASDAVGVRRVTVTIRPVLLPGESWTVEANCGGCQPTLCMFCGNQPAQWWAEFELPEPGLYEVVATAVDHAGRTATSPARRFIRIAPSGVPDPFEDFDGPPNCFGPLEDSPVCFDPFEDGPPFPFD